MFHHAHIYRLLLVVAHLDFKRFVQIMLVDLQPVIGTAALACHVERVTGIHTDVLIARSVVDHVLTGKLNLPIIVVAVEKDTPFWEWHCQGICFRGVEIAQNPYFWGVIGSVWIIILYIIPMSA